MAKQPARINNRVVAAHADDLARIVPQIGVVDLPAFWSRVRDAWSADDLRIAIVGFRSDGNVEPFRGLLQDRETRLPHGYWEDWERVRTALLEIADDIGRFPTNAELSVRTPNALRVAIREAHGGIRAVRERLGFANESVAHGHWMRWETCEHVLRDITDETGTFPSPNELSRRKLAGLRRAIIHEHGGFESARNRMGVPLARTAMGTWLDKKRVEKEILRVIERLGRFPSAKEVMEHAGHGVMDAIGKKHGGLTAIQESLGYGANAKPLGYWMEWENTSREFLAEYDRLGRVPSRKDLLDVGNEPLMNAISHHGGLRSVAEKLKLNSRGMRLAKGHWKRFEHVMAAIEPLITELGHVPSYREMKERGLSKLATGIWKYHEGLQAVAARLGYGPVTDDTISARADALTTIVPSLDESPTKLWSHMKRSWTVRDLDVAIAAHAETGSLDAFRRLLDGPAVPSRD